MLESFSCQSVGKWDNIVTCISIGRQRLGEHIPAGNNSKTSVAMQQSCKHAFATIEEAVFCRSASRLCVYLYKEDLTQLDRR